MNQTVKQKTGKYDTLYQSEGYLWPLRPGRMVKKIVDFGIKPGRALDLGCGDGKNLIFLAKNGWNVDGIDISQVAIEKAKKRSEEFSLSQHVNLTTKDVLEYDYYENTYDLIVSYGLCHCLDDVQMYYIMPKILSTIKPNGYFVFAIFNDELPIPQNHKTEELFLRNKHFIIDFLADLKPIELMSGEITENHLPKVGTHKHSLTWGIFQKNDL